MSEVKSSAPIRTILRERSGRLQEASGSRKRARADGDRERGLSKDIETKKTRSRSVSVLEIYLDSTNGTTYRLRPTGKTRPSTSLNSPGCGFDGLARIEDGTSQGDQQEHRTEKHRAEEQEEEIQRKRRVAYQQQD